MLIRGYRRLWSSLFAVLFSVPMIFLTSYSSANSSGLKDIGNSYAQTQINTLFAKGIVVGDEKGFFHPQRPVTRAEFVTMLSRTLGLQELNSQIAAFRDVPKSFWAYQWIQSSIALGIVNGTSASTFSPDRAISREEAATLLVRSLKGTVQAAPAVALNDIGSASSYSLPYIKKAVDLGIMSGYQGNFRPKSMLTREEIAVVLERIDAKGVTSDPSNKKEIHLGWQYQATTEQFIQKVKNTTVNTLSPRWFFLTNSGEISDDGDLVLVKWAHDNDKQVWALIGNGFDADLTDHYLSQDTMRKSLIDQIIVKVKKYQLDGINIDFEGMNPASKAHFTLFIQELAAALHSNDALLSIDVPPDLGSDWSEAFDYTALGKVADYLVVMSYDEHWGGSPVAGSVASLPWFQSSLQKLTRYVPANKLIAGMPLYTRDWFKQNGKTNSNDLLIPESYEVIRSNKATVTWNPQSGQYIAAYKKNGLTHQIWLEDSRSLSLKYKALRTIGYGGAAYWYIGSESADVWTGLKNAMKYQNTLNN